MFDFLPVAFLRGVIIGLVIASILVTAYLNKEKFNFEWFNYRTALIFSTGLLAIAVGLELLLGFTPDLASKIFLGAVLLGELWFFVTQLRDISQKFITDSEESQERRGE